MTNFRNLVSEIPIMHWLLTHGADPNIPDNRGRTALGAAACELDPPHIQMLLDHGAKLELGDALHAAAGTFAGDLGRIEMMQYLLAQGADINQREVGYDSVLADKYPGLGGKTPLHNAVRRWNQDIVGFLLGRGADPNIKDNSGRTPLDIAEGLKDVEMVALLKGYQDIVSTVVLVINLPIRPNTTPPDPTKPVVVATLFPVISRPPSLSLVYIFTSSSTITLRPYHYKC